jgi:ribosomal protein S18 acetylase RimI-like enzyme
MDSQTVMIHPTWQQLTPPQLAEAADANFAVHIGWAQARTAGMTVRHEAGLLLADSGLASDTFNFLALARLHQETAPARIAAALDYFRLVQRPFAWWVGPADQPETLGELLTAAGLEQAETELAMALDLTTLVDEPPPPELEIRRVQTLAELQDFALVNAANWDPPDPEVLRYFALIAPVILTDEAPQWFYVGYVDGEAVATAELALGGGVVGLYNIGTRTAYRNRGYGTALTRRPLLDARNAGYGVGVLQAAAGGVRIYQRLGFTTFGQITEYKPPAAGVTVAVAAEPQPADIAFLEQQLASYNLAQVGYTDAQRLVVLARNGRGEIVGGLAGWTYWGWLAIDLLWLAEDARGQGYGTQLLQNAEAEARRRGCQGVLVDTMSFQAPDFYRRHGYECYGTLEGFAGPHRRHYFRKSLG